jgi:hypothetical protein
MTGALTVNGTKANPVLSGDILGDWREEVIVRGSDNQSLRIYVTIIEATSRLFTLMHDSQYRAAIAWQNVAYKPPHPSFFLGAGMATPQQPLLFFGGELSGDYNADNSVDAADWVMWQKLLGTNQLAADGDHDGTVDPGDYAVWQKNYGAVSTPPGGGGQSHASTATKQTAPLTASASAAGVFSFDVTDSLRPFSQRRPFIMATESTSALSQRKANLLLALNSIAANDDAIELRSTFGVRAQHHLTGARDHIDRLDAAFTTFGGVEKSAANRFDRLH